ncbi:hypothetical protein SAMN04515618_102317 [Collimonas sp. OK307]|uniref:hypothetical protein n=1 Tax=Collimonas sp. OK307 TaxID=1801620 RepID=UPI0008E934C1|nr:hypothetical protein [Collimonas sp. OK307]SFH74821.1 hypothetical protein SAMN04515618_102317 [Collimonas sp. OK307]
MWDDLTKSVKAQLYERASSPLFGSFVLAWICWNYRFILVLTASGDTEKKLNYVDSHIFRDYQDVIFHGICYPFISAVAFIYLYPIVSKSLYKYWQNKQKELKLIQQQIEDDTPMTQADARELRSEVRQKAIEYDKTLSSNESQIAVLTKLVKDKQDQIEALTSHGASEIPEYQAMPEPDIDNDQLEILRKLAESSSKGMLRGDLIVVSGPDKIANESNIDQLLSDKFAAVSFVNGARKIVITPEGRKKFLQERGKSPT